MTCGFTPEEIREMTLLDIGRMRTYWGKHPPVHLLVAAFMGYGGEAEKPSGSLEEFLSAVPQRI